MKVLYLMRHAKSSWETPHLSDRQRPLLDKGVVRAEEQAKELKESGAKLDSIWTSDAVRATQTAEIVRKVLDLDEEAVFVEPAIYDARHVNDLLRVVRSIPDDFETVLLVGHNPVVTEFARLFTRTRLDEMKTAQIIDIRFNDA